MNTVKALAEGQFQPGQAVGEVTGYIARITNPGMFAIQDEAGQGKKVTVFLPRDSAGLPAEFDVGKAVTCHGLTFNGVYRGKSPKGPYTQNQFDAQSVSSPSTRQPGQSAQPPAGNGDKDARIERQSARRDAVMLVAGMLANPHATPMEEIDLFKGVENAYKFMLKLTGTEALPPAPAKPTLTPGQVAFRKELTRVFGELSVEAEAAVNTAGKSIYKDKWEGWRELTDTQLEGLIELIRDNKQGHEEPPPASLDDIPF